MPITAAQIAEQLRGEVLGDGSAQIDSTAHIGRDCQIGDDVCLFPNVVIGRHCIVMGRSGFAGSTRLGIMV
jgi:UDP-3-O-[3-hydroxymyristoyl] glucosamine N-acyltransferase